MKRLANEKEKYFDILYNENLIKYKKQINLEKLYHELKNYEHTFYMSIKETMAKLDTYNLREENQVSSKDIKAMRIKSYEKKTKF